MHMKKIIYLTILTIFLVPFSYSFAADRDVYVLDQTIQQVPPDILMVLDLSGSMRWTPAGSTMYIDNDHPNHQNCGDDVAYYPASKPQYDDACTIDAYGTVPKWGNQACSGPFYRSARTISGVPYTTDCSRAEVAKR